MKRRSWIAALVLLAAGGALAVEKGDALYIRSRNTKVLDKPKGRVVATLQPGETVTWNGVAKGAAGWHEVKLKNGKRGVLLTANLSTRPPPTELRASGNGEPIDQSAFLSSGAATKALADAALKYGEAKSMGDAIRDVQAMEAMSDSISLEEVAKHTAAVGLPVAVGAPAGGKR